MKTSSLPIPLLLTLCSLCTCAAARGDWLVTADGARVETSGEWRVEGRRVVFTLPNGTLSALRLSEVDLEASRAATDAANQPPEQPVPEAERPKPEPVLVLTDKDIPKAMPESTGAEPDASAAPADAQGTGLRVIEWSTQPEGPGLLMTGRLENATGRLQNRIRMTVQVLNDEGELLATTPATLAQGSLVSGGITVFRARFPDFQELPGTPDFVFDASDYTVRGNAADAAADEEDQGI